MNFRSLETGVQAQRRNDARETGFTQKRLMVLVDRSIWDNNRRPNALALKMIEVRYDNFR